MSSPSTLPSGTKTAAEIIRSVAVTQAVNGICYAAAGETAINSSDLERMVGTVPATMAAALARKAYYFVPLTVSENDETIISERYDVALSDRAICHRNLTLGDSECVFISTRLMDDKFSVAFEFFINIGHAFVDQAGVSAAFSSLAMRQVEAGVKGETSLDAHDFRRQAFVKSTENGANLRVADEKANTNYLDAAFADSLAIYMLSLYLDVDYWDLREREYPLLAPNALAERLRLVQELFPPNPGYEFAIYYRRRT
ncbi:MAG: hypothetical protein HYX26_04415 [Acidobacteriales bacterium]|nr:hypothetical protein [Terriglobales bacterium]